MRYRIVIGVFLFLLFSIGCGAHRAYQKPMLKSYTADALVGSWYSHGIKYARNNLQISERKKEQFFRNGQLLSSKWFNIRDRAGRDLGEFYITKLFTWKLKGNRVVAKFNRCDVGIVRALKIEGATYSRLKRACQDSLKRKRRVSVKRVKFLKQSVIMLGNKLFYRE